MVHGFGVFIARSDGGSPAPIVGCSDTNASTEQRGFLAGVLSALEWCELNCHPHTEVHMRSPNDYIIKHLPKHMKAWAREEDRANRNLIEKISAAASKLRNVKYERCERSDLRYKHAMALAAGVVSAKGEEEE
jgi:ribonuclease HI